ncbi:molybdopterin-dependent oxidoreductase [Thermodesulfobacteriota bacterium]
MDTRVEKVATGGCHDCGGRCPYTLHVKDGRVVRMEPDDELRACLRGYALRQRVYSRDRLTHPLKRTGKRGEGSFTRISWDEALDIASGELQRVREKWGNRAILHISLSGSPGGIHGGIAMQRLFNMFGGAAQMWGGPSAEGYVYASRVTHGTLETGNSRDDLANTRFVIMWGWNPVETIFGVNVCHYLMKAKEAGAKFFCVDPRFTRSAAVYADQWIPIRPGTDVAMMLAMAFVLIRDNLHDADFIERCTLGFDKFKAYVTGDEDGMPKTPEWAQKITGVPASTIETITHEYGTVKPAALIPGYGPGRTSHGEQFHRAAATLAAMTGNVGKSGGNTVGFDRVVGMPLHMPPVIPWGKNPVEAGAPRMSGSVDTALRNRSRVHWAKLWDCILEGTSGGYPYDIRLAYIVGANPLNQIQNVNKGVQALTKLESVIVHEQFMTPTAKYADLVLPVNTHWARDDLMRPWYVGSHFICVNKAIESLPGTKSDFEIACELAPRLGISDYTDKDARQWRRWLAESEPDMKRHITDYERFEKEGVWRVHQDQPVVSLKKQVEDPQGNPFPTPSGKIEIYSRRIADLKHPELPPVPKFIEPEEGPASALAKRYPLQLITHHFRTRAHSCFDNVGWLKGLEPQALWLSHEDAQARGISDGKRVAVFNDRGKVVVPAKVTHRILPGVVALGEGAWYDPDEEGIDRGGCPNVLTKDHFSPGGAFVSNSCLVQVEKA